MSKLQIEEVVDIFFHLFVEWFKTSFDIFFAFTNFSILMGRNDVVDSQSVDAELFKLIDGVSDKLVVTFVLQVGHFADVVFDKGRLQLVY
jgi:hypothetical protein